MNNFVVCRAIQQDKLFVSNLKFETYIMCKMLVEFIDLQVVQQPVLPS